MFEGISLWQESGLTQKAWCEKNNIAYGTFHYWYKMYRDEKLAASSPDRSREGGFVKLTVDSPLGPAWCELAWSDGKKLVFHQPISAEFIRTLIG